ncbi:MAG: hypothetical protein R3E89_14030 [Thiolinea sp.]
MELFKSLLGEVSISKMASLAAGLLAAILLFWLLALGLTRRRVAEAQEHRLYRQFCERLAQLGVATSQTPGDFAEQAALTRAGRSRIRQFTACMKRFATYRSSRNNRGAFTADAAGVGRADKIIPHRAGFASAGNSSTNDQPRAAQTNTG